MTPPPPQAKMATLSKCVDLPIILNESIAEYMLSYLIISFSCESSNDRTCGVYTLLSLPKRKNLHRCKVSDPIAVVWSQIESRNVLRDI